MEALKMINTVNCDNRVGIVQIKLDANNEWNDKIMTTMISRFSNVYVINVNDYNNSVYYMMHGLVK